jgi:hypothetical protein
MPDLDALARMTRDDDELRAIFWCKDRTGFITEHVTTAYEGHRGHIQCIAVAAADPSPAARGSES